MKFQIYRSCAAWLGRLVRLLVLGIGWAVVIANIGVVIWPNDPNNRIVAALAVVVLTKCLLDPRRVNHLPNAGDVARAGNGAAPKEYNL